MGVQYNVKKDDQCDRTYLLLGEFRQPPWGNGDTVADYMLGVGPQILGIYSEKKGSGGHILEVAPGPRVNEPTCASHGCKTSSHQTGLR